MSGDVLAINVLCERCNGEGIDPVSDRVCPDCDGDGLWGDGEFIE